MSKTKSAIYWRDIKSEGEINGRWVIEARDGTLVADHAPVDTDESLTFTAPNGKRYWDTTTHSQWTPRTVEIDIKKLTEEAVNHMESVEDVRWSVGMALQELYGDEFVYAMQIELGKKYLQHTGGKK